MALKSDIGEVIGLLYCLSEEKGAEDSSMGDLSNLKLQKLLYYAQGFSLAKLGRQIFSDKIIAWEHGPVIEEVYRIFKVFIDSPVVLPIDSFTVETLDKEATELIKSVYEKYGKYSAWHLRNKTHAESPWKQTTLNHEITHDKLAAFFKTESL
jgi:uncharacterized phage-associated protein